MSEQVGDNRRSEEAPMPMRALHWEPGQSQQTCMCGLGGGDWQSMEPGNLGLGPREKA